nr:acyltransferase [Kibdelosporangium sp. MJ126-NF4]CEL20566.1 Acyltransferase mdmB [Kibdelosporangium sp. MJ126-NF4]CTQ89477.1 Acyltransferase mdmB (EC 2.3.1.-) [Kibdelosporangium sp. MJ126-NF4]
MRFAAAILVFLAHIASESKFTSPELNDFLFKYVGNFAYIGVEFFFILSGFVLTWSARPGDRPIRFWRRRFMKIYPNHLVTWLAGLVLVLIAGKAVTTGEFLPGLFLVNAWVPVYEVIHGVNGPAWSLGVELVFYLCFPVLLVLLKKIRGNRLWLWTGALALSVLALPLVAKLLLPDEPVLPGTSLSWWQFWFTYFLPVSRMFEFAVGILMARIVQEGRWIRLSHPAALLTLVPGFALTAILPDAFGVVAPLIIPLALVIASGAAADVAGRRTWASRPSMVWLGEISFAFYLLHLMVAYYGPVLLQSGIQWDVYETLGRVAVTFVITVVLAWLLYRLVELPAIRRWSRPRKADKTDAPVEVKV